MRSLLDPQFAARLEQKLGVLKRSRPLPASVVAKLRDQFAFELTYNSNAIEGNRLTLKETYLVVSEGITVKGKSLKDHLEAKDHYEAIQFLFELVEHGRKHTVSEHLVRSLHQLVVRETEKENAGSYRQGSVMITGSSHRPLEAHEVPHQMRDLIRFVGSQARNIHPVELAAIVHHRLVFIHPFVDGNGRTARLFMNLLLMQAGYPLVVILKNDRKKYYDVLHKADRGDLVPLIRFVAQSVERSLSIYLRALAPSKARKRTLEELRPLAQVAKGTPYSAKYLNLLVRQGKLEAHKEGRVWLTTRAALERYLSGRKRKRIVK